MDKDKLYGFIQEKLEKGNELGFDGLEKLQKEYMQESGRRLTLRLKAMISYSRVSDLICSTLCSQQVVMVEQVWAPKV